jgi:hypothetical protein
MVKTLLSYFEIEIFAVQLCFLCFLTGTPVKTVELTIFQGENELMVKLLIRSRPAQ